MKIRAAVERLFHIEGQHGATSRDAFSTWPSVAKPTEQRCDALETITGSRCQRAVHTEGEHAHIGDGIALKWPAGTRRP